MKKLLIITTLGISAIISSNSLRAEDNRTEQHIGFASGLLIGAAAGGPVGALIGAVSGVLLGEKVNEAEKVEPLESEIAENKLHLESLKVTLEQRNQSLDQAYLQLSEQTAMQMKVADNQQLLRGLQVDLMFRTNSRELEAGAIEKIAPLILMLEQFPTLVLQLSGHGDALGTKEGNRQVAHQRTLTVKQVFIDAGIEQNRIHLKNLGKEEALAAIEDIDGRALDRRVRVQFMQSVGKSSLASK